MKWCTVPYSLLAMTKESEYSDESRLEVRPAHGKYLFVYPFVKTRAWYLLAPDERWRIMQEHIKLGREYPSVELNTSYSFGLDDQEFVVAFDELEDFQRVVGRVADPVFLHAEARVKVHLCMTVATNARRGKKLDQQIRAAENRALFNYAQILRTDKNQVRLDNILSVQNHVNRTNENAAQPHRPYVWRY